MEYTIGNKGDYDQLVAGILRLIGQGEYGLARAALKQVMEIIDGNETKEANELAGQEHHGEKTP